MPSAQELIAHFGLIPLPVEGGLYRQTYKATENIAHSALPARYQGDKPFGVAILFFYTDDPDSFSALHGLPTDEIYHFYLGDAVELLQLYPDGRSERIILGHDVLNGQQVQYVVPRGVWMGSRLVPGGQWALIGTTMAPGFTDDDYVGGEREALLQQYPSQADLIQALTRPRSPLQMPNRTE
jgi:hypothetical protein